MPLLSGRFKPNFQLLDEKRKAHAAANTINKGEREEKDAITAAVEEREAEELHSFIKVDMQALQADPQSIFQKGKNFLRRKQSLHALHGTEKANKPEAWPGAREEAEKARKVAAQEALQNEIFSNIARQMVESRIYELELVEDYLNSRPACC